MTFSQRLMGFLGLFLAALVAVSQNAAGAESPAHAVVRDTTRQVMDVVQQADAYADEDPERYYQEIQAILDPVIDYRGFARGVMGPYATSERYRSLDEAGRAQLRDQLDRFTEVMRVGLVRTYSKGLLAFGGSRIEVDEPGEEDQGKSRPGRSQPPRSTEVRPGPTRPLPPA